MSDQRPLPVRRDRLSAPLIFSIIFLAASIAASIFIIRQVTTQALPYAATAMPSLEQGSAAFSSEDTATADATMPIASPVATAVEPSITPSPRATLLPADTLIIGFSPLTSDVANLTGPIQAAVEAALSESPLPQPYEFVQISVPAEVVTRSLELSAEYEVDLLLAWENEPGGLLRFYIASPSQPSLGMVGAPIEPWPLATPGNLSLYSRADGDRSFPAELAAAALEQESGFIDPSLVRIQQLQALPMRLSGAAANHNRAALSYMAAQAEARQGDFARALQSYSEALRYYEDFAAAHLNRANLYLTLGDWETAHTGYQRAGELAPESSMPLYNDVLSSWKAGELETALEQAQALDQQYPDAAWSSNLVGLLNYDHGAYEQALGQFQRAASLDSGAEAPLFNEAFTLHTLGRYDEALNVYSSLVELAPDNPVYLTQMALTYQAQENYRAAVRAFSQAIALDSTYVEALLLRGQLYLETEDYDRATADATSALELDPDEGRAYEIMGDALLAQEDFAGAVEAYSQGIDLGVTHPEIYAKRGWAWHRQRYVQSAVEDYQQAIEAGSTDPLVLYRMGFALLDAGRYEDALEALLGAIDQGIDTPEAHAILAVALDANFRRDEAEQAYQRALDLDSRYGDPEFLAEQILWSPISIQRAEAILRRMEED